MAMSYKFTRIWRQHQAGDPVPPEFDEGMIGTMLSRQIIEPVDIDEAEHAKAITAPPADKRLHAGKTRRKGAA
jgi:hypothetical protein